MTEKIPSPLVPYKFEHAIKMLKQAIEFGEAEGDYLRVRVWAHYVEESHNAEVKDMQEAINGMNEGLKLMHSLATGGETSVLSRLDNGVDVQDAVNWQDAPEYKEAQKVSDNFNFDTVAEQEF